MRMTKLEFVLAAVSAMATILLLVKLLRAWLSWRQIKHPRCKKLSQLKGRNIIRIYKKNDPEEIQVFAYLIPEGFPGCDACVGVDLAMAHRDYRKDEPKLLLCPGHFEAIGAAMLEDGTASIGGKD